MPSLRRALATDDMPAAPVLEVVGLDGDDDEELEIYEQPPPGPSLGERHQVDDHTISPLTAEQKAEAARCLRSTTMFKFCSDESITRVVEHMRREQFTEGEVRALGSLSPLRHSRTAHSNFDFGTVSRVTHVLFDFGTCAAAAAAVASVL